MSVIIPDNVRKYLENLKFLSLITEKSKPCFATKTFVSSDTSLSWFYGAVIRTIYREGQNDLVQRIKEYVNGAITTYESTQYVPHKQMLVEALKESRNGIAKLLVTYDEKKYPGTHVSIVVTLAEIDSFLKSVAENNS
jgi:DNA polymerase IIIc chi subunit